MMQVSNPFETEFEYDICLSFAGEQRPFVEKVAGALRAKGIRVFFDDYEKVQLWGKDLYAHLDEVYQHLARYCVLFVSAEYAAKVWTNHERRSAQARAIKAKGEYILPARFDATPIPGLTDTVGYVDLTRTNPEQLADLAFEKLGRHERRHYLPPHPDKLFIRLGVQDENETKNCVHGQAWSFLRALQRMNEEERHAVLKTLWMGCPADLPDNVHIDVDLLRRLTGSSAVRLKRILGGLRSLGFECSVRDATEDELRTHGALGDSEMLELTWRDLGANFGYPALAVAEAMVTGATDGYCEEHGWAFLERLDFSQLATVTATVERTHAPSKVAPRTVEPRKRRKRAERRGEATSRIMRESKH